MKTLINIWMQPVYARLNMDSRRSLFLLLAFFPLGGEAIAAMMFFWGKSADAKLSLFFYAFLLSVAAGLVILAFTWFVLLVMNIGMQYSPANAVLVPGMTRQLKLALALPMVIVSVLSVLIASIVAQKVTIFPAFFCVLLFSFFVGVVRLPWLVFPVILAFQVPAILARNSPKSSVILAMFKYGLNVELLFFAASAFLLWGVLRWFFAVRDDEHFRMHKRTLAMRQGMNSSEVPVNQFAAYFSSPFLTWMRRCIRLSATSLDVNAKLSLATFATGPRLHWATIVVQLMLMIVLGVAMVFVMSLIGSPKSKDFLSGFAIAFPAVIMIGLPLMFCTYSFFTLYQTRTEQALFSLTPVVRHPCEMDGILTRYLLRQFAILMGLSLIFSLLMREYGKDFKWIAEFLSLGLSSMFVFVLGMASPFGKMRTASDHPLVKLASVSIALLLIGVLMTIFISSQFAWWLSAAIVLTTSVTLMFRLKRNAQTVQFPVGRAVS